jgi:hypothetical protein
MGYQKVILNMTSDADDEISTQMVEKAMSSRVKGQAGQGIDATVMIGQQDGRSARIVLNGAGR